MIFKKTTEREEQVAERVVNAAYKVHKALGPGLLEKVYEVCFCHEPTKAGLSCQKQVSVPINYNGVKFEEGLRLDVLVENIVLFYNS